MVALLVAIKVTLLLVRGVLDVQTGEDYQATYVELQNQPLIIQQLVGILAASELAVAILAVVVVIARSPRLHGFVAIFVVGQIVLAIVTGGSRSAAFSCALAYVVARSIYDRRFRFLSIAVSGALGVLLFLVAGALRQSKVEPGDISGLYLLQGGEFLSVFYNSLDLHHRLQDFDSTILRVGMYLVDILRFIPRQFVGDFKIDPAAFYVATFYPEASEAGGGLAFGAIAESTIGFGPIEALVRGALIGYLYAVLRNVCLRSHLSVLRAFIYTWFVVLSYQAIRDTTFSVFARFFFQVVPVLAVVWMTGSLRSRKATRRARGARQPTIIALGPDDCGPSHPTPPR